MTHWLELLLFTGFLFILTPLLGKYLAYIFQEPRTDDLPLAWLEKKIYRLCGIDAESEMHWQEYARALLLFNLVGLVFLFVLQLAQAKLPFNPQNLAGLELTLAFNTAISFVTNTNWQAYGGETTMSYLTQMSGLTVQNFASAATGNAVLIALIRGIQRKSAATIGNFWQDFTRTILYILLPLSFFLALFLVSQGVVQTLNPYAIVTPLEQATQTIALGPVASQVAIKQLGTNGGGFFNANSAHPYENPTVWTNFFETLAIFLIPAAATYMYGILVKSHRQGWVIFWVMFSLWVIGLTIALFSEYAHNPVLEVNPVMEGKETRFGNLQSILWAVTTTGTSNGSVNSMHSSLSPLAGGVALFNMMIGEVIFGGVGVGLCSMLMFVLLTVFLAGLMVGRTPEYLGKKIEKHEMQWVILAILAPTALILLGAGAAIILPVALESLGNVGPHGLSEILYAFSSAAGNNGSAFAGLNANTPFYNLTLGFIMLLARLAIIVPSLAIAGSLATKKTMAASLGTFSTKTPLFGVLLFSVILVVAALTFFPALSLGPLAEQFLMLRAQSF